MHDFRVIFAKICKLDTDLCHIFCEKTDILSQKNQKTSWKFEKLYYFTNLEKGILVSAPGGVHESLN
jgi:hypothetical protein